MSFTSEIVPIGESVFRKSFGLFLCSGVSTAPGATALKRIFSFAYSVAKLRVTASSPPLVIIGTEAVIPAIGLLLHAGCCELHHTHRAIQLDLGIGDAFA